MKKVLASVGIGNATVDTVLETTSVSPGDTVDARIEIDGGDAEQEVGAVRLELETEFLTEDEGYRDADLRTYTLSEGFTIEPGEERTIGTQLDVPYETPLTVGGTEVWVETELDISMAVDPEDVDYLDVEPTPRMAATFDAMEKLGFSLHSVEVSADPFDRYFGSRFAQEFEYVPASGEFAGDVDEVELLVQDGDDELDVFVEVDRRGGVFTELAEADEERARFSVGDGDADVDALAERLRDEIAALS
ncbi:sporulation protein [Halobaculum sp. D14]|uniref:sporulation protein n=1 Tax=unclassified Halobaculum TaxID=2640896 RepID=UPI003EBC0E34